MRAARTAGRPRHAATEGVKAQAEAAAAEGGLDQHLAPSCRRDARTAFLTNDKLRPSAAEASAPRRRAYRRRCGLPDGPKTKL